MGEGGDNFSPMMTILGVVFTFGLAIFIHEFGHFIIAKMSRFKVEVFSIGFGKRLIGLKKGGTDYRLSLIPFGGYVKMAGEEPRSGIPLSTHEFLGKPWWKRMGVYLSGPLFNIVLSAPIFIMVFLIGAPTIMSLNVIGNVEKNSIGERVGLKVGDVIVEVNGQPVKDWYEIEEKAFLDPSNFVVLKIKRDGLERIFTIKSEEKITQATLGIHPVIPPEIGSLRRGYPAEKAGLRVGDIITSLNGVPVHQWSQMAKIIHSTLEGPILIGVRRCEEEFVVSIVPVIEEISLIGGERKKVGLIGIGPKIVFRRLPIIRAIPEGLKWVFHSVRMVYGRIWYLLTGRVSLGEIIGPIGIAQMAGKKTDEGIGSLLWFIAFLSVNLGVLNLLPIPMLDGGHIVFCIIEGIRGRRISLKIQEIAIKIGFAFILTIFIFITINDLIRTGSFKKIKEGIEGFVERLPWVEERQDPSR